MSETLNSSPLGGEIQSNDGNTTDVQSQSQDGLVKKEDYISLQSDYTKKSQMLKDIALELAKKDPESILSIKDTKLQNKVISEMYGVSSLQELKQVFWDDFYKTDSEKDTDEFEKLKREVKILRNSNESQKVENEIEKFKLSNKDLFVSDDSEQKLRDALSLISSGIESSERIKLAATIAFGSVVSNSNKAYQALQNANVSGGKLPSSNDSRTQVSEKERGIRDLWGLK